MGYKQWRHFPYIYWNARAFILLVVNFVVWLFGNWHGIATVVHVSYNVAVHISNEWR